MVPVPPAASLSTTSGQAVPALPRALVRRPRLEARLADGERRQITLVAGLPGAGKTTLVASWLHAAGRPAAWLGLDGRHDEPGRLVRAVVRALAAAGALPDPAPAGRRSDASLIDAAVEALGGPCVLVLDDAHELRSATALAGLRLLLDRAPPALSVVLCARADPPVALGRLRLAGRLGEIRNADLEFTRAEAADLLAAHGIDLRHDDVAALWRRTQGWAAGLRLAAGALAGGGDPGELVRSAAATEAAVADYLLEEVLDRQDPGTQRFLLRTSVADRLTPELAAALAGDERAGERLDELERNGVFLADGTADGWYRYHALFADLLRAKLRRRHPDHVAVLHGRAADWLVAEGRPELAEPHARLAGDWALAGRLAADRWLAGVLGDREPPPDPVAGVAPDAVARTPALALAAAAAACSRGDRDAAALHRTRLGAEGNEGTCRMVVDLVHGWAFGADRRAHEAAGRLAVATDPGPGVDASALRRFARLRSAGLDLDDGHFDRSVTALNALADTPDGDWTRAEAAALVALVHAANGNLAAAGPRTAAVLAGGDDDPDVHPTARLAAHLAAALGCAQRGEHRRALAHLRRAEAAGAVDAHLLDAAHLALRAGLARSRRAAAWLDSGTAAHPLAGQALIACGALEVVDPQRRLIAVGGAPEREVARARHELARGASDAAYAASCRALAGDDPSLHPRTAVEAHTLGAVAATRSGRDGEAAERLGAALDLAASSGVRAPLLDHRVALAALLDRVASDADPAGEVVEVLDHLRRAPGGGAAPVEPLTDREAAVLRHLPTLMSNAEIAEGLHLSINTVKTHLKAVYRKLGVDGRRAAVLRARELELI
jgi:LuxR family maltose regulon positive regulatory protein